MLSKSVISLTPALALISALVISNAAFANGQAKFKNIEKQLGNCPAYSATGYNICVEEALDKYERAFTKSQKAQYSKQKQACIAKFGDPFDENTSGAAASTPLDCMHKAAKAVAKKK